MRKTLTALALTGALALSAIGTLDYFNVERKTYEEPTRRDRAEKIEPKNPILRLNLEPSLQEMPILEEEFDFNRLSTEDPSENYSDLDTKRDSSELYSQNQVTELEDALEEFISNHIITAEPGFKEFYRRKANSIVSRLRTSTDKRGGKIFAERDLIHFGEHIRTDFPNETSLLRTYIIYMHSEVSINFKNFKEHFKHEYDENAGSFTTPGEFLDKAESDGLRIYSHHEDIQGPPVPK